MEITSYSRGNTVKNQLPIIILASISVFFAIFSIIIGVLSTYIYYTFIHYLTVAFSICIKLLLIFYVAWFHKCKKSEISIIVIYAYLAFTPLLSFFAQLLTGASISFINLPSFTLTFLSFTALLILTLFGLRNKAAPIAAASVAIFFALISIISTVNVFKYFGILYFLYFILNTMGSITLHTALLIFGLSSTIQPTVKVRRNECAAAASPSPEERLLILKEKHELGIISDGEYASEKREVIEELMGNARVNEP